MSPEIRERITNLCTDEHPDHLEGWATPEKALAMCELIEEARPRLVVEIGVFGGRSLIPQAMALRDCGGGMICGIDPWELDAALEGNPSEADRGWWRDNVKLSEIHENYYRAIAREGVSAHVATIRSCSHYVAQLFPVIDILHIDGNHTELASVRDVNLFLPRVRKKGYIWFDDIDWTTTQAALAILDKRCTRLKQVGNCALYLNRPPLNRTAADLFHRKQERQEAAATA